MICDRCKKRDAAFSNTIYYREVTEEYDYRGVTEEYKLSHCSGAGSLQEVKPKFFYPQNKTIHFCNFCFKLFRIYYTLISTFWTLFPISYGIYLSWLLYKYYTYGNVSIIEIILFTGMCLSFGWNSINHLIILKDKNKSLNACAGYIFKRNPPLSDYIQELKKNGGQGKASYELLAKKEYEKLKQSIVEYSSELL